MRPASGAALALGFIGLAHAGPGLVSLHGIAPRIAPRLAGRGHDGHVALTFDDGPDDRSTLQVLDVLAELEVTATFFWLAGQVERNPAAAAAVVAAGHEVGVHASRHRSHLERPPWAVVADLRHATTVVRTVTGIKPRWMRPPYGVMAGSTLFAARRCGLRPVLWTAWGRDWRAAATPGSVVADLAPGIRSGATLLLHDADVTSAPGSWRSTVAALPDVVALARSRGLVVGPLADHLPA